MPTLSIGLLDFNNENIETYHIFKNLHTGGD